MMVEPELVERINMLWPQGLKDAVKELVGNRGVTKFTIESVRYQLQRIEQAGQALGGQQPDDAGQVPPGPQAEHIADLKARFGLKTAAEIGPPARRPDEPIIEPTEIELSTTDPADDPADDDDPLSDTCPECRSPLIAGECWTCP